ncbi:TetR/AcrR family transcriptional regulator [Streptomyces pacificus]|uniref:TetR/AcrR family transcriptional regulator n=1 Tax=Streptomyces pacificus TaxID=2705029 RepID=A0A6A0AWK3_9ACTN|nr:TetR/AcrR family transcriptional regulator [Streptomyces pacificus]GFH37276.1 TetR/AcrR family transcriptional regulator [Streptomyces pacificus]
MATQEERKRATRRKIMDAAGDLFAHRGIEATTTEALLSAAGVSRGAMYHHFDSREDLVAAVYEEEAAAAIARAAAREPGGLSARERLLAGCLAWLDEVSRPGVARILIEDGPAALGWRRCRRIEEQYSLGRLTAALRWAVDTGEIRVASVELTARLMNAVLAEAALIVIAVNDQAEVRADVEATLRALLSGLASPSKT